MPTTITAATVTNKTEPPSTYPEQKGRNSITGKSGNNKTTQTLNYDLNATIAQAIDMGAPHEVLKKATWNTQSFCREKMAAIHERLIKCYDIAFLQEVHHP